MNKINYLKAGVKYLEFKILGKHTSTYCWHNPIHAEIDITGKCNFNCIWCYRKKDLPTSYHSDISHLLYVLRQLKGIERINICALGEPLLVPVDNLESIITTSLDSADEVIITTNGSLLKNEMANMIAQSSVDKIAVSIDHCINKEFKKIRGFDLKIIKNNVISFRKIYHGKLQMNVVVTEQLMKYMPKMVQLGHELGFDNIIFQPLKLYDDCDINYNAPINNYKNRKIIKAVNKKAIVYGIELSFSKLLLNCPMTGICKQPFYQFVMNVDGFINPCCSNKSDAFEYVYNVRDSWNCKKMREYRKNVIRGELPLVCKSWCEYIR